MKKSNKWKIQKPRLPLAKQRNQAFKDKTKYNRKNNKGSDKDPSFLSILVGCTSIL